MAQGLEFIHYQDGECIFQEGDTTQEMYVVQSGEVVIRKENRGEPLTLAVLRRGEFVGEMSLLESLPRSAHAYARGPTKLLRIQAGGFLLKIRRDPTFAFELLQALSRRIRTKNEQLIAALSQGNLSEAKKILENEA